MPGTVDGAARGNPTCSARWTTTGARPDDSPFAVASAARRDCRRGSTCRIESSTTPTTPWTGSRRGARSPAWLDARLRAPATRFVAVAASRHPFVLDETGARRPCYLAPDEVDGALPGDPILLGVHGDIAYFAVDATDAPPPFPARVTLLGIRDVITDLAHRDSAVLAYANALVHWHRTHRFCGACGTPTTSVRGGHVRRCSDAACGREHFPRTDPAVITLVCDGDRCLLARRRDWAPGRRSTVAGFRRTRRDAGAHRRTRGIRGGRGAGGRGALSRLAAVAVSAVADARLPRDGREHRDRRRRRRDR